MQKHRILAAALALVPVPSLAHAAPAHADQPPARVLVQPAPGSQTDASGSYFLIRARPGARVRQSIWLRNQTDHSITVRLAAADAVTGPYGGASYGLPSERVRKTGAWIAVSAGMVTVGANAAVSVPFTVAVPAGAEPGQHLAGLSVWLPGTVRVGSAGRRGTASASIALHTRNVVAVEVDEPGRAAAALKVTEVRPAARPDGLYLEVGIANGGNALTKGEGSIEIAGTGFARQFPIDTFVPGTRIRYPLAWPGHVKNGTYTARVQLRYDGKLTRWRGTFTVGKAVRRELEDRGAALVAHGPHHPPHRWMLLAALATAMLTALFGAASRYVTIGVRRREA